MSDASSLEVNTRSIKGNRGYTIVIVATHLDKALEHLGSRENLSSPRSTYSTSPISSRVATSSRTVSKLSATKSTGRISKTAAHGTKTRVA